MHNRFGLKLENPPPEFLAKWKDFIRWLAVGHIQGKFGPRGARGARPVSRVQRPARGRGRRGRAGRGGRSAEVVAAPDPLEQGVAENGSDGGLSGDDGEVEEAGLMERMVVRSRGHCRTTMTVGLLRRRGMVNGRLWTWLLMRCLLLQDSR